MGVMSYDALQKKLNQLLFWLEHEEINGAICKRKLKWNNIIAIFVSHGVAGYAIIYELRRMKWQTLLFGSFYGWLAGIGITAGVHRLWTHRSYKAKLPLRIILAFLYSMTGHNSMMQWVLDHRTHHKFTETDADPHNAARGFFFSHVGWLMQHKSHAVKTNGKLIDMTDIDADPVVAFHERYYWPLKITMAFVVPTIVPRFCWDESWYNSVMGTLVRYIFLLNCTWSVNSLAHIWGSKPYDQRIGPAENKLVAYLALGEGWHNYHHVFPWDYRASEFGMHPNVSTKFIDAWAKLGLAYDLKTPSDELISRIASKYGDGSKIGEVSAPEDDASEFINMSEVSNAAELYNELPKEGDEEDFIEDARNVF